MDEDHTVDGWAVLHDRSALPPSDDYATLYLVGPFPNRELADLIKSSLECPCRTTVVPVFFPPGLTMMVAVPLPDTGMPTGDDGPIH